MHLSVGIIGEEWYETVGAEAGTHKSAIPIPTNEQPSANLRHCMSEVRCGCSFNWYGCTTAIWVLRQSTSNIHQHSYNSPPMLGIINCIYNSIVLHISYGLSLISEES